MRQQMSTLQLGGPELMSFNFWPAELGCLATGRRLSETIATAYLCCVNLASSLVVQHFITVGMLECCTTGQSWSRLRSSPLYRSDRSSPARSSCRLVPVSGMSTSDL